MKKKNIYILTFLTFIAAIFTRFVFLGYSTLIYTEAERASATGFVLNCFNELPFLAGLYRLWHIFLVNSNPLMSGIIFNTPIVSLCGLDGVGMRLNAAIGGILTILLVYILIKRRSDNITALFALILLTFNPFLITFNRFGNTDSLQTFLLLGGLLILDRFTQNPKSKLGSLILSSLLFAIAFLLKYNAIIIIALFLLLYCLIFNLKFKHAALIFMLIFVFSAALFFDQIDKFVKELYSMLGFVNIKPQSNLYNLIMDKFKGYSYSTWVFLRGHAFYFEQTVFPLCISLLFWRKIQNKMFKFMVIFSILYFGYLFIQGRAFYRYLQIGMVTTSVAFAFPLKRFAGRKYFYGGAIFLVVFTFWQIFSHFSYVFSQYHHIPYPDIVRAAKKAAGEDNSIILYGRNAETEFYFSPDGTLFFDATKDPSSNDVVLVCDYPTWREDIKKIQPKIGNLLDPEIVKPGDVIVVSGIQMDGGEPNPKSLGIKIKGIRLWGIREYGHRLEKVKAFYKEYNENEDLRKNYVLLEKVFLSNGSKELAALILRKND